MCLVDRSYPGTACDGRGGRDDDRDPHLEDQERTSSVVDRTNSAKPESAAHMAVRLSRIGFPVHFVESHCSLENFRYSGVQVGPALYSYAVYQQILVVLRPGTTLVELGRSSHHCYSSLHVVVVVACAGVVHPQIRAGPAPGKSLVELGLNNHRCLSFAHQSTHSCCFDSTKSIGM